DGLNLLKTLRQDFTYKNLIIVIVTSSDESATRLSAYSASADDIMFKPLDKSILQKRILNLAERFSSFGQQRDIQEITGLVKTKSLMEKLHDCLIDPRRRNEHLAVFEIDHFADWSKDREYSTIKGALVAISN